MIESIFYPINLALFTQFALATRCSYGEKLLYHRTICAFVKSRTISKKKKISEHCIEKYAHTTEYSDRKYFSHRPNGAHVKLEERWKWLVRENKQQIASTTKYILVPRNPSQNRRKSVFRVFFFRFELCVCVHHFLGTLSVWVCYVQAAWFFPCLDVSLFLSFSLYCRALKSFFILAFIGVGEWNACK